MTGQDLENFTTQTRLSSPGRHGPALAGLPNDVVGVRDTVQGWFLHCDYLELYDVLRDPGSAMSRETRSLEYRLGRILRAASRPISTALSPGYRDVVTCRDYALAMCGILRHKQIPARVRCGFANYFARGRNEDHWICEYRDNCARWRRIDAQLDGPHRAHLGIAFDTADLPRNTFLTAREAWQSVRRGEARAGHFGHGAASGEWFLWVNLVRDYAALAGRETSPWDFWREVIGAEPELSETDRAHCDRIAKETERLELCRAARWNPDIIAPFWSG